MGVTAESDFPGSLSEIPQVTETARHIRVSYSYFRGVPAPLTNGGLNEHGVAARDVWSPSRPELNAMTPSTQNGPNYSDLSRLVLERARTAREGVELIGELTARHGHSTYGGNSHLIADADEAWVVIEFSGGQGLWAAERLGPDSIRVTAGLYRRDFRSRTATPIFSTRPTSSPSRSNRDVSIPQEESGLFNANLIYGDGQYRWAGVTWIEAWGLIARSKRPGKISIEDIAWAIRTPKLTGDTAGYGQIVPLGRQQHSELRVLWHTQIGSLAAPFVPVYMGVADVPEEFKQHRYLTAGESARCIDMRKPQALSIVLQQIEATRSAAQVFRRLLYVCCRTTMSTCPRSLGSGGRSNGSCSGRHGGVIRAVEALIAAWKEGIRAGVPYLFQPNGTVELLRFGRDAGRRIGGAYPCSSRDSNRGRRLPRSGQIW